MVIRVLLFQDTAALLVIQDIQVQVNQDTRVFLVIVVEMGVQRPAGIQEFQEFQEFLEFQGIRGFLDIVVSLGIQEWVSLDTPVYQGIQDCPVTQAYQGIADTQEYQATLGIPVYQVILECQAIAVYPGTQDIVAHQVTLDYPGTVVFLVIPGLEHRDIQVRRERQLALAIQESQDIVVILGNQDILACPDTVESQAILVIAAFLAIPVLEHQDIRGHQELQQAQDILEIVVILDTLELVLQVIQELVGPAVILV